MLKGMYSEATPMMKLFIFIVVLLVCTAAFSIGGVAFAPLFFGTDAVLAMADEANYTQPNVLAVLKFLQIFSQLGIMIIPSLMAGVLLMGFPSTRGELCCVISVSLTIINRAMLRKLRLLVSFLEFLRTRLPRRPHSSSKKEERFASFLSLCLSSSCLYEMSVAGGV